MAYKPPLEEGELHSTNIKSIRKWIEQNKGKIKAKPNETMLYSGRDYDLEVLEDIPKGDRKEFKGTPMYKVIDKYCKQLEALNIPYDFQTLPDVLKSIRDCPTVVDRDRQEQRFSNAFECFNELGQLTKLLPNAKSVYDESWKSLSDIFASNAEGDIRILDGGADDYGKLEAGKVLIEKELKALLKNSKLSDDAKKVLKEKISKYGSYFDRRYTKDIARLNDNKKRLKGK
jgi:hypothetical protein